MSRNPVTTKCLILPQAFHPKFTDEAADIILSSNQGTLFRISSATLRSTSRLLQLFLPDGDHSNTKITTTPPDMSGLSLDNTDCDAGVDAISLPFEDAPIARVLLILSAQPIDPWKSFRELEAAIDVMEYLDTPGPLSVVRASCFTPIFCAEPIRLYGLAARFGWEEVLHHAAELTLNLNLFPSADDAASKIEEQLMRLPAPALYRLIKLHRRRRDKFRALIYSVDTFSVGNAVHINCSCGTEINNSFWRELRSRLVWELDQNPSGRTILAPEMEEMDESARCWKAKCSRCSSLYYNRLGTSKNIRMCVEKLPKIL